MGAEQSRREAPAIWREFENTLTGCNLLAAHGRGSYAEANRRVAKPTRGLEALQGCLGRTPNPLTWRPGRALVAKDCGSAIE